MKERSKKILSETIWLAVLVGIAILISLIFFGKEILSDTVDFRLHDAYFVIESFYIFLSIFLLTFFVVYFIQAFRHSFQQPIKNWIVVIAGLTLVVALSLLIQQFSEVFTGAFVVYTSPETGEVPDLTYKIVSKIITNVLMAAQVLTVALLIFVAFRWGTQKRSAIVGR